MSQKHKAIVADVVSARKLNLDPDDLKVYAIFMVLAQLSEMAHTVHLNRNTPPLVAATMMSLQRAGKLAHKMRDQKELMRGAVDMIESYYGEEAAQAYAWLLVSGSGLSLQRLASRWAIEERGGTFYEKAPALASGSVPRSDDDADDPVPDKVNHRGGLGDRLMVDSLGLRAGEGFEIDPDDLDGIFDLDGGGLGDD